jgi:hypothetical protein
MSETNKSFNLNDFIKNDKIKNYIEQNGNNVDMNKISELINGKLNINEESTEKKVIDNERREELRSKLREKTNVLKGNRTSKETREKNQINELKQNPLFQTGGNANPEDIKNMIEAYSSKMTKDTKQKKNIKKQMNNLIEKMNNEM